MPGELRPAGRWQRGVRRRGETRIMRASPFSAGRQPGLFRPDDRFRSPRHSSNAANSASATASASSSRTFSFTVPRGKVTALMGASGGGKTTILRLIGGQVRPSSGEVLFDGQDVGRAGPRRPLRGAPAHGHAVPVRRAVHRPERVRQRGLSAARAHRPARRPGARHRADEAQCRRPARRARPDAVADLRRHGAPGGTGARDRARPRTDHVRRALRRPGPDLARHRGAR